AEPSVAAKHPLSLDDLYSEAGAGDVAVSPSGRYLAIIAHRPDDDIVVVVDLTTGERKPITRVGKFDAGRLLKFRVQELYWKTETRLLFTVQSSPRDNISFEQLTRGSIARLGRRLYA